MFVLCNRISSYTSLRQIPKVMQDLQTHIRSSRAFDGHGRFNARVIDYDQDGGKLRGKGRNTSANFDDTLLVGDFVGMTKEVAAR